MWKEINNQLVKEFKFNTFQEAFAFLTRVAFLSEAHNHHPTIINTYSTVKIELCTHDAGNKVTERDHQLATDIDKI